MPQGARDQSAGEEIDVGHGQDFWRGAYERMYRIRSFELRALELQAAGEIPAVIHSSAGQEAISVGMTLALRPGDFLTSTHRGHGHLIGRGMELDRLLAELCGKKTGVCGGRGGTMHVVDLDLGILGTNGIVGAGIPIAVGAALSILLDGDDRVVMCFFGDGALSTGAFHEAVNLAALWRLPVVFACENNQYAESTPVREALPIDDIVPRAASYGIPGHVIDGNDLRACLSAAREAVGSAREGRGPTLIQAETYRYHGHYSGDRGLYRPPEEVEDWQKRDPVERLRRELLASGAADEAALAAAEQKVRDEIARAVEFARRSPEPDPGTVLDHVYASHDV
jgi:TPP-dependent pyruvate/acetoin dehydrogenase alpha subunit